MSKKIRPCISVDFTNAPFSNSFSIEIDVTAGTDTLLIAGPWENLSDSHDALEPEI